MSYDALDRDLLTRSGQTAGPGPVIPATAALVAGLGTVVLAVSGVGEDSDFAVAAVILLAAIALSSLYVTLRRIIGSGPSWVNPDELTAGLREPLMAALESMRELQRSPGDASVAAEAAIRPLAESFRAVVTAAAEADDTLRRSADASPALRRSAAVRVDQVAALLADLALRLEAIAGHLRALDELAARSEADQELARRLGTPLPTLQALDAPADRISALYRAVAEVHALEIPRLDG